MHPIMHPHEICLSHASQDYLPVRNSVPRDAPLVSRERRPRLVWGAATLGGDNLLFCSSLPPCIVCVRHFKVSRFIVSRS